MKSAYRSAVTSLLPLFPLKTVLLPGAPLPLYIFEPRYRQMVGDLLALDAADDRRFGVIAIRQGREVGAHGVRSLHEIGCAALMTEADSNEDGTYTLRTVGTTRFVLQSVDDELPYLRAAVEWLPEPAGDVGGLAATVAVRYRRYLETLGALTGIQTPEPPNPDDPRLLSYLVAATVVADLPDRQGFLAAPDAASRLAAESAWLSREHFLMTSLASVPAGDKLGSTPTIN